MPTDFLTDTLASTFRCQDFRGQEFLWDSEVSGLGVRATPRGRNAFIFQGRIRRKTIRRTLGGVDALSVIAARSRARQIQHEFAVAGRKQGSLEQGGSVQPLEHEFAAETVTAGLLWSQFLTHGRASNNRPYSDRYIKDLRSAAQPPDFDGALDAPATTGPLHGLMVLPLRLIDEECLVNWFQEESRRGPHRATRALMMFRAFLRWSDAQPALRPLVASAKSAACSPALASLLPKRQRAIDVIEPSDLATWWAEVLRISDKQSSAFLQCLVMTGIDSDPLSRLEWSSILFHHKFGHFRDRRGRRLHFVLSDSFLTLIQGLPRCGKYVFAGLGETEHLTVLAGAYKALKKTLADAGLQQVGLTALQRTYFWIAKEAGLSDGAVANLTGRSPRGARVRYGGRSSELLSMYMRRVDAQLMQRIWPFAPKC